MYHPQVIERNIARYHDSTGIELRRYEVAEVETIRAHLEANFDETGKLKRPWRADEQAFMRNEVLLTGLDFRYWAERYWVISLDGGGIGKLKLAPSQLVALERHIAPAELEMMDAYAKGEPVDGLLFYWHKARQLYATALCRALLMHRETTQPNVRGLSASVDEDKIQELYDRDMLGYDNLPFYLKPAIAYNVKAAHVHFAGVNGKMLYQIGTQKSGVGQGRQFDAHHLTECSFWESPEYQIDYILKPAIPRSVRTLGLRESSGNGRGNWWHTETEDVRAGRSRAWRYIFIPYYALPQKYCATPPADWTPAPLSLSHAKMVEEASPEFMGYPVHLSKGQLYWYEQERDESYRKGKLAMFLTNYCATPEESFQHLQDSAFGPELMERLRHGTSVPGDAYEVLVA